MYTKEQTEELISAYTFCSTPEEREQVVLDYAKYFEKSVKSIIGKLSKEGVYVKQRYLSKTGTVPITKLELVAIIAEAQNLELNKLEGLDKAPKLTLKYLANKLTPDEIVID